MKIFLNLIMVVLLAGCANQKTNKMADQASAKTVKQPEVILVSLSKDILKTLSVRDFKALAVYVHPELGVRFTTYTFVDIKKDRKLTADQLMNITQPKKKLLWGEYDGSGEPINMTISEYFSRFVYDADFLAKGQVTVNEITYSGNTANNVKEAYPGCEFTEFMIPEIDPQYEGADWRALRLVFKKENDKIYLVGIIHNEFTI